MKFSLVAKPCTSSTPVLPPEIVIILFSEFHPRIPNVLSIMAGVVPILNPRKFIKKDFPRSRIQRSHVSTKLMMRVSLTHISGGNYTLQKNGVSCKNTPLKLFFAGTAVKRNFGTWTCWLSCKAVFHTCGVAFKGSSFVCKIFRLCCFTSHHSAF